MHLRRSHEEQEARDDVRATAVWDELPAQPSADVVIKAPRAADLVAPAAPVRAA
jgi:hypothetical protein